MPADVVYLKNHKKAGGSDATGDTAAPVAASNRAVDTRQARLAAPSQNPLSFVQRRRGPTPAQRAWLMRGLGQAGGKLPLFDSNGQRVNPRTIRACLARGWAEPWFANPVKPDWLVCKLTPAGRAIVTDEPTAEDPRGA